MIQPIIKNIYKPYLLTNKHRFMKKITFLMVTLVLYSIGVFAQIADLEGKIVRIGTAQAEMVPGKWYFLHTPRNPNTSATDFSVPGEEVHSAGGLVYDNGTGLMVTATSELDVMSSENGVSANDCMSRFVRFVAVAGTEGAYCIQFGTGKWAGAAPGDATMTQNQYLAGQAGQYNFYLVNINGASNQAGRFGWNKYDMQNRVDNNGAGNDVVFWGSGERTANEGETGAADGSGIGHNDIWQIYDVEILGTEDPYESAFDALLNTFMEIDTRDDCVYIANLQNGINVGHGYGNYLTEDVEVFLKMHALLKELIAEVDGGAGMGVVMKQFPTVDDLTAYHDEYKAAEERVRANRIPLAVTDIAPGFYLINSIWDGWYVAELDTVYYTQEEADQYNEENKLVAGDDGYVTPDSIKEVLSNKNPAPVKSLCTRDYDGVPYLSWGTQQPNSDYLWKIETVDGSDTRYRLINMAKGMTFNGIPNSNPVEMKEDDTVTVVFDYQGTISVPVIDQEVVAYSIRNSHQGSESSNNYMHTGDHANGAGVQGRIVGWNSLSDASKWYLTPVDDEVADQWINGADAKVRKMVTEAENIIKTVPAQLEVAKDMLVTIHENDSVVVDASQFYSPYTTTDGGPQGSTVDDIYSLLLDGNTATFWHSAWRNGNVPAHTHYLQIEADEALTDDYCVRLARRRAGSDTDHPVRLAVVGYDVNDSELGFDDGENLGSITFPYDGKDTWAVSNNLFEGKGHKVLRFYWEDSNGDTDRGFWHCSGFNIFKAEQGTVHEKTQYQVREGVVKRLQAAMDAWNAGGYSAENGELLSDEVFVAAYNELIAAGEAWKAVYVDPAALRAAINNVPAENLFVTGNNPGQWKVGSVTPAATVNEAKAYDEAGAYTPAESERLIRAIADATAQTYASANKVETGKWYRIKFPAEEMYDNYGWSKTGAKDVTNETVGVEVSGALFGKTVAVGRTLTEYVPFINASEVEDTLATYKVATVEEAFNGQLLCFFDDGQLADINEGDDLFRFIQATDSSYIIQNKSTGLFLCGSGGQPATLSDVPTFFYVNAVGAGANIITYTNVLGETVGHRNLHGDRANNRLVCWESANAGSNSALLIEEAEAVSEEPATSYGTRLWPGTVNTYVKPVDVSITGEGATAYGAELAIGGADGDTAIVLKKIEAETIKAGTPYILIADDTRDEYITPTDRLKQLAAEITAEKGEYGYFEKQLAAEYLDYEYVTIEMNHGMSVDTLQKGNGALVGTFRSLTVEAGKGIVAKDNGFAHTLVNTTVGAYGAYIKCDFDPEGADVLSTITIKIEGSVETGIADAISKVAKSGNIYTVDGRLVVKGNINAINRLPAGIYIVNGVKVTKR